MKIQSLIIIFFAWWLIGCTPQTTTTLMSVVNQDIRVEIVASADWEAADGHIQVVSEANNKIIKTIQFAKADDYVDDIRNKVSQLDARGRRIVVCLRYAELAPKGEVYTSPSGVVVEVIKDDGTIKACRDSLPE
jgi:tetrahydromethanopterin S-methyltransferase subunit F